MKHNNITPCKLWGGGRKKVGLVTFAWAMPPKLATQLKMVVKLKPEARRVAYPPTKGSASKQGIGPPGPYDLNLTMYPTP